MLNPVVIQGIGVLALLVAVSIFQTNKRKTMLLLGMSACLLWSAHFFLIGAVTGAARNMIGVARSYVYFKVKPTKQTRWILWTFVAVIALATTLTWQGILSLLPLIGSIINIVAYWQKKPKYIRRLGFASSPPWLTYNVLSGSYPGMIVEVLLMISNLIGQYRFDFRPARTKQLRTVKSV